MMNDDPMPDFVSEEAIRRAGSMEQFADGEDSINLGEWRAWLNACMVDGRDIPPAEFKAWPEDKRLSYRPKVPKVTKDR